MLPQGANNINFLYEAYELGIIEPGPPNSKILLVHLQIFRGFKLLSVCLYYLVVSSFKI